ncbi:helix-turn-helix domain-containing protein [Streptomyces sp. NBC_00239]|uniref:helix-turn-helix domain-containing protein n=1 Tax=Streptomyces sp. NBC_00239 TaxID=2903640 RepID=UPI002E27BA5D|nr:helix-turn-helix transcriptional regulator [Streptomyces sp. NBC_00239]
MSHGNEAPGSLMLREVGVAFRQLRERRDLTQGDVAERLGRHNPPFALDGSAVSRIELGRRKRVAPELAEAILDCLEADPAERREVLAFLQADSDTTTNSPRPALWRRNAALLGPMRFEGFLALELRASGEDNYEPKIVPGRLQTREYAEYVISAMREELSPVEIKGLVDIRMDRQSRIAGGAPRQFRALLDEEGLRKTVKDKEILKGQLERLLLESEKPWNAIRVLPESVDCHPGTSGAFVLMHFPEPARSVVWLENMVSSGYFDEALYTDAYTSAFSSLWQRALDPDDTRMLFKKMIRELQ